jgi:drug/metabolite transporter (DMT)-like permease
MKNNISIGIIAGLTTGALWGLTFVAPRAVQPFTEYDLAIVRYAIFGLLSFCLMAHPSFQPRGIRLSDALVAMLLGSVGYIGYFLCAAFAVRFSGAAIPPLIIGLLPVLLAVIGNFNERSVSFKQLFVPLGLITIGILIVNGDALAHQQSAAQRITILVGAALAIGALVLWVGYGVINADIMRRANPPPALAWAGLQGLGAGIGTIPLMFLVAVFGGSAWPEIPLSSNAGLVFLAWAAVMGIAGSWIATWCWSVASTRLPLALSAQLIVAETIFGLGYGFLFEMRWPRLAEFIGAILQVIGVGIAVYIFQRSKASTIHVCATDGENITKNV